MRFENTNSDLPHNFRVSHLVWSLLLKEDCMLFSIHSAVKPQARRSIFRTRQVTLFSITLLSTTESRSYVSCATPTSTSIRDVSLHLAKVPSRFYLLKCFTFTSALQMHVDFNTRLKFSVWDESTVVSVSLISEGLLSAF